MNSNRGILGSFISLFVATIVIVIILLLFVIASRFVQRGDNFGARDETDAGLNDVFVYMDVQFSDMVQLRAVVKDGGLEKRLEEIGK